ncbi:MAG: hypothetical protein ACYS5V_17045, partial [Planctomycetota bacterium]
MVRRTLLVLIVLPAWFLPAAPAAGRTEPAVRQLQKQRWRQVGAFSAARARAAVDLAGQIQALALPDGAKVGDFLDAAPEARRALLVYLTDLGPAAPAEHRPDGTCQLTLRVTRAEVAEVLGFACGMVDTAGGFEPADFAALKSEGGQAALTATASAEAGPGFGNVLRLPIESGQADFDQAPEDVQAFWSRHVSPAGRAAAESRARDRAAAGLLERIKRVRVDESSSLAEYVAGRQSDADLRQF